MRSHVPVFSEVKDIKIIGDENKIGGKIVANKKLHSAKNAKNDEFYTQYADIQNEVNAYIEYNPDVFRDKTILLPCDDPEWSNFTKFFAQNFERFGLKKLISTSYSNENKKEKYGDFYQMSFADYKAEKFDEVKEESSGKIFTLTRNSNKSKNIDFEDLKWDYLKGDGDFRSEEVNALRSEADIIVTNPPFSLYREFVQWIFKEDKKFLIIGNMNSITYSEIFPLIKDNKMWVGNGFKGGNAYFETPNATSYGEGVFYEDLNLVKFRNVNWFTNLEHGRRHEPMRLMTMEDNLRYNKGLISKLENDYQTDTYPKYDNYDALEVPLRNAIPSDYNEVMGVPTSFLDVYNPEQFEILGITSGREEFDELVWPTKRYENAIQHNKNGSTVSGSKVNTGAQILLKEKPEDSVYYTADNVDGYLKRIYTRLLIRHRR